MLSSGRCGSCDSRGVFSLLRASCPRAVIPLLSTEPQTGQAFGSPFQAAAAVQVGQGTMYTRIWGSLLDHRTPVEKSVVMGLILGR